MTPITQEGYRLLHDGSVFLSKVEHNGIRIDMTYLRKTREQIRRRREKMERRLRGGHKPYAKVWKLWRKRYGDKASLTSATQLGQVMFRDMGFEPVGYTASGQIQADQHALEQTDHPFVAEYLRWKKLGNAEGNFLAGIEREVCGGFLHPVFNLNTVWSYRSSSDSPNFQQYPVRDEEISRLVRRCFIPRRGHVLVENDFKGLEVAVAACYCRDPKLIAYVKDPSLDMHRDMACQLFKLPLDFFLKKMPTYKEVRHSAKNLFVFPQFYGDWYKTCAASLWEAIGRRKLLGPDGRSLYAWLAGKGITELGECDFDADPMPGTFEYHVMKIERDFWNNRFKVYKRWKRQWFEQYLRRGFFESYTGFRYEGVFEKNQVTNVPIQGSGFHCLLWTGGQYTRSASKTSLHTKVCGQIHDSILTDVPEKELDAHNTLVAEIVSNRLPKHWDWIIVPMIAETEIVPSDATWFDKRGVDFNSDMTTYSFKGQQYNHSVDLLHALSEDIHNG